MSSKTHTAREWKEFIVGKVFDGVQNSKAYHKAELHEKEFGLPYVSRTNANNGLEAIIDNNSNFSINQANTIVFGAENAEFFYQPYQYITGNKMYYIESQKLNKYTGLFVQKMLSNSIERCGFGYGKGLTGTRMKNRTIVLPIDDTGNPDRSYMESYMKQLEHDKLQAQADSYFRSKLASLPTPGAITPLSEKAWDEFFLEDVFHINSGKRLTKNDMKPGKMPFIGASDTNNGITQWVSNTNSSLDQNVLGVNYNGSVVENFYHPYKALFSDDVKRLSYKHTSGNKYLYLFAKTMIIRQKSKYQYAYKFNGERMARQKILLPINHNGSPDYSYMEQYMQQIEYRLIQRYLEKKEKMRGK